MEKGENDLGHTLRLLEKSGFVFRDLGLSREDSANARLHIRYELGKMVDALADKQPHDGAVIESLARPALNGIQYLPSAKELHVTVGSRLEVGGSFTSPLSWWRFLRPTAAITMEGLSSFLATSSTLFAVTPVAGVLVEPLPWNTGAVQWRFGLRGGYYLSSEDDFGSKACPDPAGNVPCSRPTVQLLAGITLFQRLRFQLMGAVLPPFKQGEHTFWAIVPSAGLQFDGNR
jgi:hypothetical protein